MASTDWKEAMRWDEKSIGQRTLQTKIMDDCRIASEQLPEKVYESY